LAYDASCYRDCGDDEDNVGHRRQTLTRTHFLSTPEGAIDLIHRNSAIEPTAGTLRSLPGAPNELENIHGTNAGAPNSAVAY